MLTRFVAARYLLSHQKQRYFSWITNLTLLGIAIGVSALIVVISVLNGFEHELTNRFLNAHAPIMAYRYPAGMSKPLKWAEILKKDFPDEVSAASPFIHYETMAKKGSIMHGVMVRGIDPIRREKIQPISKLIKPKSALKELALEEQELPSEAGLIIGSGLADILNVKVGERLKLVSPNNKQFTDMKSFKVLGFYRSGLKRYDNRLILMSVTAAGSFFNMGKIVTGLEIGLKDPNISEIVTQKMEDKYNLSFREWKSFNRPLFSAIERERVVISLIVAMVVLVAGFNILTTIFVSVSQKQKDISILKALGARNKQITRLFVTQGVLIGIFGSLLGCVFALIASAILQETQFIELPDPYFLDRLPVHGTLDVYLTVVITTILICFFASFYPALIASRVEPSQGLRENIN